MVAAADSGHTFELQVVCSKCSAAGVSGMLLSQSVRGSVTIYQRYDQELADKIIAEIRAGAKTTIACRQRRAELLRFCRWRNDRPGLQHRAAVAQSEWRERRSEQVEADRRKRAEERESSAKAEVDQLL